MSSRKNNRKKIATLSAAVLLTSVMMAFPALAHGHGHGHGHHRRSDGYYQSQTTESQNTAGSQSQAGGSTQTEPAQCPVCTFDHCVETGRHFHDGTEYCGYHHEGGYCDNSCVNGCRVVTDGSCDGGPGCHHGTW